MRRKEGAHKSLVLSDMYFVVFAMLPALLCSVGVYGHFITQVEKPSTAEHMIFAGLGLAPSLLLYFVLLSMEGKRKKKIHERKDRKRYFQNYSENKPFNNGNGLLSRYNGVQEFEKLSPEEIVLMKAELKKQLAARAAAQAPPSKLDLKVDEMPTGDSVPMGHGVQAYFRGREPVQGPRPQASSVPSLEEALRERLEKATTPEEANPFRPINAESVQDTLRHLEEVKRQKFGV